MHVEALASRESAASPVAGDEELELRVEAELPERLAVGRGNAVFVYGSCFHRRRKIRDVRLIADGRSIIPMAQAMPRRDLFEIHPHAYRSGFWAIVPVEPTPRPRALEIQIAATLEDGSEVVGRVAALALEPVPRVDPVPWAISKSGEPAVAVCMATYNPPIELLRRQLDSIRAQTHRSWICVISDDHSRADRFAKLEAAVDGDPRFVVSRSPERLGFYRNFERALTMAPAGADYIALADQDDRWHREKLELLISRVRDSQLVYCDARVVGADGEVISDTYWNRRRTNHSNLASLLISNTITGAASLFRRQLLDTILPFPPRLGAQWHDHWIGLVALATGRVEYLDRPLYDYVQHRGAVVGHAVANPTRLRRGFRERMRMLRSDRAGAFGGWCWKYFYGVCRTLVLAHVLELRCGETLRGRKRRALAWFLAIDRSAFGYGWLSLRRLRRVVGLNETLGGERVFLNGLAWRRIIQVLTLRRRQPPGGLRKDASLPPAAAIDGPPGSKS